MNTVKHIRSWTIAGLGAGLLLAGSAGAWFGDPWNRPYGSGPMVYERQNTMRDHQYAMSGLQDMFVGRRAFNREEAVRLARDLEAGFGEDLIRNYAPGTRVAGSRTAPWTWNNFGAFSAYAGAAKQAAAQLASGLESEPSNEQVQREGAWMTDRPRRFGQRPAFTSGNISMDAIRAYSQLNATCHTCHASFRGPRW